MNLKHIHQENCPTCNAPTKSEGIKGVHTHGQRFEWREYICGCLLEYIPNFGEARIDANRQCPNSEPVVQRYSLRRKAIKAVVKTLREQEVDKEFLRDMQSRLEHWLNHKDRHLASLVA